MAQRSYWPQSLAGRTILMVIVAVLLMQLMTLISLANLRLQVIQMQGLALARAYVVLGRSALAHSSPEQFAHSLQQQTQLLPAQGTSPIRLIHHPTLSDQQYVSSIGMTLLYRQLHQAWGGQNVAISTEPDERLLLRLQDDWWIQILSVSHQDLDQIGGVMLWILLGIVVVGALIAVFVLHLLRPLLRIEQGIQAFADGGDAPQFELTAPREMARLAQRLEQMMSSIRQHETERHRLLSGLPHDLRAPLTRLKLRLALLGQSPHRQAMNDDLDAITHLADQYVAYLHGLQLQASPARIDLVALLHALVQRYQQINCLMSFECALQEAWVALDAGLWQRLLDNMIENARQHGQPPIVLGLGKDTNGWADSKTTAYLFWIEDHGQGIDDTDLTTALQPFAQLSAGRGVGGQVGLGLSIVQQILQAHQLRYQFDRDVAGGLRLCVWLPALPLDSPT